MKKRIFLVSRELDGMAEAGGLKDAVAGLALGLRECGEEVRVYLPLYGFMPRPPERNLLFEVPVRMGETSFISYVYRTSHLGLDLRLVSAPGFAGKHDVYVYTPEDAPDPSLVGKGHLDSLAMNAAFQASVTAAMEKEGDPPYVVHGHDGHCGLLPLYMQRSGEFFRRSSSLTTIHNAGLAYQQTFPDFDEALSITGLPADMLGKARIENQVNPFLAAAVFGHVNTVSPAYARRLRGGKEPFSGHLSRIFRERNIPLPGIYNGLEPSGWLQFLPAPPRSKKSCRRLVHEQIMMKRPAGVDIAAGQLDPARPWVLFHGRLTPQKGLDEILRLSGTFSADIIVYGRGDPETDNAVADWVSSDSGRVFLRGYDSGLTPQLIAAADFVLVPSHWEPCGQIDMLGQLLGALPIVRAVDGLLKVRHRIDGFRYAPNQPDGLERILRKALKLQKRHPIWVRRMRRIAEKSIYERRTWRKIALRGYLPLYRTSHRKTG